MPFKTLTNLYFDNKVQVLPVGAISFFGFLDKLDYIIKTPGLIDIEGKDIISLIHGAKKITLVALNGKGSSQISKKLAKLLSAKNTKKAFGALFYVVGDGDLKLFDVNEIAESVYPLLDKKAEVIFGASVDNGLNGLIRLLLLLVE